MRKRNIKSIAHWCIMGVLLLFPVLMVGVSAFANDEQTTTVTETYQYETNEVNSVNDFVVGNIYKVNLYIFNDNGTYNVNDVAFQDEIYLRNFAFLPYHFVIENGTDMGISVNFSSGLFTTNLEFMSSDDYIYIYDSFNDSDATFGNAASFDLQGYFIWQDNSSISTTPFNYSIFSVSDYLGDLTTVVDIQNSSYKQEVNNWANGFKNLEVNGWYKQLLNVIGIGETTNSVMNVIYVYPLYVLWVYILDLIVDCLLLIVRFGHDALQRLGADNE